ncbi:MAG: hypothetical protein QXL22_03800 [Candidatus Nezhaarchaeales archaeon]
MMKTYICTLRLCDYLTYSSSVGYANVMGVSYAVYKPQPYLHNYSLMYGFSGLLHASLASSAIEVGEIDYYWLDEVEKRLYVYPARPRRVNLKRMLLNIKGEGAVEIVQPKPKSMYPWHVVHLYFAPGSEFETVLVARSANVKIPNAVRVGVKRQGIFSVKCEEAEIKSRTSGPTDPVNLGDLLRDGVEPASYVALLDTKTVRRGVPNSNVIAKAYFNEPVVATLESRSGIRFRVPLIDLRH